jgi:hypothetical protein
MVLTGKGETSMKGMGAIVLWLLSGKTESAELVGTGNQK